MDWVVAYQMLHRSVSLEAGDRIFVHGASGGRGTAALQLGKLMGLETFGTASARNHGLVRQFGAQPIDYESEDFVARIRSAGGVKAVLDGVGGSDLLRSYRCLHRGGTQVFYGLTSALKGGRRTLSSVLENLVFPAGVLLLKLVPDGKGIELYSIQVRKRRHPEDFRQDLSELFRLLENGSIAPVVARRFDLTRAAEAHEMLARGGVGGKIVLTSGA